MDGLFPLTEVAREQLGGAVISPCGTYRYTLDRVWDASLPVAVYVMLNPSTADATEDDRTIVRCNNFAKREGYGGITVINLFALRSTDPEALRTHPDPVGPHNTAWIGAVLDRAPAVVIAAWGAHPFAATRAAEVAKIVTAHGVALKCLGTTKAGAPKHPLYLAANTPLINYRPRKGAAA
jgi:hypothetical protein